MTAPASVVDLKPCPFCGPSKLKVDNWASWYVRCNDCGATQTGLTKAEAIAEWNRRAAPANDRAKVVAWRYRYPEDDAWQLTQSHDQAFKNTGEVEPLSVVPFSISQPAEQDARETVARVIRQMLAEGNSRPLKVRSEEAADAILSLTQAAPDGWRPIETAPKDGRNILAWGYLHDDGGPYEADGRSFMGETPHEMVVYFSPEHSVWRDRSHGGSYAGLTHWRPLPAPPAQGEGTTSSTSTNQGEDHV